MTQNPHRTRGPRTPWPWLLLGALLVAPAWTPAATQAATQARRALVIGNAAYPEAPLVNTKNDAADMAAKLGGKDLGFKVSHHQDLGRRDLARAIADFTRQVQGSDAVALFYYSGHGLQVAGKNYLVPVDAQIRDERDVPGEAVPVDDLLAALEGRSEAGVNLIILDAYRNNPFKRSDKKAIGDKGLARVNVPTRGTLILYATRPGDTASDNPGGRNGLFTQYLLAAMAQPGIQVEEAFKQAVTRVWEASGRTQSPWSEGVITGQFYFIPAPGGPVPPPPPLGHLQVSVDAPGAKVTANGVAVGVAEPVGCGEERTAPTQAATLRVRWVSGDDRGVLGRLLPLPGTSSSLGVYSVRFTFVHCTLRGSGSTRSALSRPRTRTVIRPAIRPA